MKTEIKALPLSLALSFLALLGACSSVNSTPNTELPSGDNSVILEDAEEGIEAVEDLEPDSVTGEVTTEDEIELESAEIETTDGMEEDTAIDTEETELESAEIETTDGMEEDTAIDTEETELESAEIETTDGMEEDAAIDTEVTEEETAEEVDPTEIILPESDSAEVETDSEAAENLDSELEIETQPE